MSKEWTLDRFAGRVGFDVVRAEDDEVSDLVHRFRYHVYVTLVGRRQLYADHARKTIREPLDERGQNYLALKDGAVIGTIRRNTLDDPSVGYYRIERLNHQKCVRPNNGCRIAAQVEKI
jgi:hypothetical protein